MVEARRGRKSSNSTTCDRGSGCAVCCTFIFSVLMLRENLKHPLSCFLVFNFLMCKFTFHGLASEIIWVFVMNEEVFFRRPSVAKTWLFSETMLLVSEIFQTLHEDSLHSLFLFCFFQVLVTSVKVTEASQTEIKLQVWFPWQLSFDQSSDCVWFVICTKNGYGKYVSKEDNWLDFELWEKFKNTGLFQRQC